MPAKLQAEFCPEGWRTVGLPLWASAPAAGGKSRQARRQTDHRRRPYDALTSNDEPCAADPRAQTVRTCHKQPARRLPGSWTGSRPPIRAYPLTRLPEPGARGANGTRARSWRQLLHRPPKTFQCLPELGSLGAAAGGEGVASEWNCSTGNPAVVRVQIGISSSAARSVRSRVTSIES